MYENELYHHGVKGMKWGRRKAKVSGTNKQIRKDRKALTKAYKAEYKQKKALGQSIRIGGNGPKSYDVNSSNYALVKTDTALRKKYGNKKYSDFKKNETSKAMRAAGAAALAGTLSLVGPIAVSALRKRR